MSTSDRPDREKTQPTDTRDREPPVESCELAQTEAEFKELVARDVRGASSKEEREYLRSGAVVGRWARALLRLNLDLQNQFTERRAAAHAYRFRCLEAGPGGRRDWLSYKARYERWRAQAARFKTGVEERLVEAKRLEGKRRSRTGASRTGASRAGAFRSERRPPVDPAAGEPQPGRSRDGESREQTSSQGSSLRPLLEEIEEFLGTEPLSPSAAGPDQISGWAAPFQSHWVDRRLLAGVRSLLEEDASSQSQRESRSSVPTDPQSPGEDGPHAGTAHRCNEEVSQ